MNIEIEKKYHVSDYNKAKKEIESLGSKIITKTNDVDVYFKVPQETPNTKYLRVRTKNGKNTLAYHEVLNDIETREWESEISECDTVKDIIQKLGFSKDVVVDKEREKYQLGDVEILIDHIKDLGYFVEIEAPSEAKLNDIAGQLTLGEQVIGKGYPDLVKECRGNERSSK